jgi:hypothetical protein
VPSTAKDTGAPIGHYGTSPPRALRMTLKTTISEVLKALDSPELLRATAETAEGA